MITLAVVAFHRTWPRAPPVQLSNPIRARRRGPGRYLAHQEKTHQVPPKLDALATVVLETAGVLDEFITGLVAEGYLGDALDTHPKQDALLPAIATFSQAFIDALVEEAVEPGKSHLDEGGRQKFRGQTTSEGKKQRFTDWRNDEFAKTLLAAAQNGVRYVGMGRAHMIKMLEKGLPPNTHDFDMIDRDLSGFKTQTQLLRAKIGKK
jgi:hypothetical protein